MALNATNYDTGDEELNTRLREWFEWDKNEATRSDILQLVNEKNIEELKKRLLKRMEFGTAGLRTRMAAGFSMMNDLTIIQTTQVRIIVIFCRPRPVWYNYLLVAK
ncbi:glucose 1,6-bisphosphate synthase-like [Mytilus edulis]|uniref:glucose 1,6-bisphosphate synthase-like n=1 Tax=Mytilus edulis TaxID=6550 RepID=UPI0039F12CA4